MKRIRLSGWLLRTFYCFCGVIFLLIIVAVGLHFLPTRDFSIDSNTQNIIQPAIKNQQEVEQGIDAAYKQETYSFAHPFVVQNPYGTAPLTALAIFDTSTPTQISIHIPGKTSLAAIDYTFNGYATHHEIPIYGLYAGTTNPITLTSTDAAGYSSQSALSLQTEPLPVYLKSLKIITTDPSLYSPGMNFTYLDHKEVYDVNGDVRWYSTTSTFQTYTRLANGHYLFTYNVSSETNNVLMEEDLLGKIYAVYNVPNGVQHDFAELSNGNLLVTTQDPASGEVADVINEIDRQNGEIVQSFDLADNLDPNRPHEINQDTNDWLHLNSIVYDNNDQSIVISGRTQSAVVKLSYPGMKIQWILGPHDNWSAQFQPYLLTPIGDNFEWQWSQHAATIVSEQMIDGDEVMNLLLFDNGLYRSFSQSSALSPQDSYSRIVLYQIDETKLTVKQLWEYGEERGSELFSYTRGSAYLLSNGDYLGTWAEILKDANGQAITLAQDAKSIYSEYIEINPANNQVVYEARISTQNYRTFRANLYDGYSAKNSGVAIKIDDTTKLTPVKRVITFLQPIKQKASTLELSLKKSVKRVLKAFKILNRNK